MTTEDKIRDEKLEYGINKNKEQKYMHYHQVKLIKINIFQAKKHYLESKSNYRAS